MWRFPPSRKDFLKLTRARARPRRKTCTVCNVPFFYFSKIIYRLREGVSENERPILHARFFSITIVKRSRGRKPILIYIIFYMHTRTRAYIDLHVPVRLLRRYRLKYVTSSGISTIWNTVNVGNTQYVYRQTQIFSSWKSSIMPQFYNFAPRSR